MAETVKILNDSKERVAFDLMHLIAHKDSSMNWTREEVLILYTQCQHLVFTGELERALTIGKKA